MEVGFVKMHGLGNDFVVLDGTARALALEPQAVARLADRRTGIGFDQLLVAERPAHAGAEVSMRILNADGTVAEQCGNGLRCFARFAVDRGLAGRGGDGHARIQTEQGLTGARICADTTVEVRLPGPDFEPVRVPAEVGPRASDYQVRLRPEDGGDVLRLGIASMGNPHAVLDVASVSDADVARLGPAVQRSGVFPRSANVGFRAVRARDCIDLRVYERGVGETRACGSGACAAVCVGIDQGLLDSQVEVHLPGGTLGIGWAGGDADVVMRGPTAYVFEGTVTL